jgi:hypothetical protein
MPLRHPLLGARRRHTCLGLVVAGRRRCPPRLLRQQRHVRRRSAPRRRHRHRRHRCGPRADRGRGHVRGAAPHERAHRHDCLRRYQGVLDAPRCAARAAWRHRLGAGRHRRRRPDRRSRACGPVRAPRCPRGLERDLRRPAHAPSASRRSLPSLGARDAARTTVGFRALAPGVGEPAESDADTSFAGRVTNRIRTGRRPSRRAELEHRRRWLRRRHRDRLGDRGLTGPKADEHEALVASRFGAAGRRRRRRDQGACGPCANGRRPSGVRGRACRIRPRLHATAENALGRPSSRHPSGGRRARRVDRFHARRRETALACAVVRGCRAPRGAGCCRPLGATGRPKGTPYHWRP